MTKRDLGWRPRGAAETYRAKEVWEYNIAPHEINEGETDGDIRVEDITGSSDSDSVIDADDL
jgi:hypothetical protein